jgi:hypothetical protein
MIFETLHRLGSKADRLMLVPNQFAASEGWLLDLVLKARDQYGVRLKTMDIQSKGGDGSWLSIPGLNDLGFADIL